MLPRLIMTRALESLCIRRAIYPVCLGLHGCVRINGAFSRLHILLSMRHARGTELYERATETLWITDSDLVHALMKSVWPCLSHSKTLEGVQMDVFIISSSPSMSRTSREAQTPALSSLCPLYTLTSASNLVDIWRGSEEAETAMLLDACGLCTTACLRYCCLFVETV